MFINANKKLEVKDLSMLLCFNLIIYVAMILFSEQRIVTIYLTILGSLITFLLIFSKTFQREITNKTIYFLLGTIGLNNAFVCGASFVVAIQTKISIKIIIVLVLFLIAILCFVFVGFTMKKEKKGAAVTNSSRIIAFVVAVVIIANHFLSIHNLKFELLTFISFIFFAFFSTFLLKARN